MEKPTTPRILIKILGRVRYSIFCWFDLMTDEEVAGERALIWALVETAIQDCIGASAMLTSRQIAKRQAIQWLFSDSREPFSFLWISQILELNPSAILREVSPYLSLPLAPMGRRRATLSKPFDVSAMLSKSQDDNYSNVIYFE